MLESFGAQLSEIVHQPWVSLSVVLNLILIESLLSVDNAAVLATMVRDLPRAQRPHALRYGLLGAYIFRGAALLFASVLIGIWWFKPLGGAYLLYLSVQYFLRKETAHRPDEEPGKAVNAEKRTWLYRKTLGMLGPFWATVVMVEVMDAAFSIDNVIAANAYSSNLILVWTGVFIGILAMRFAAQGFIRLMDKYPFLESCAYFVICLLGIKLVLSGFNHFAPCTSFARFMEGPHECLYYARGLKPPSGEHPLVWGDLLTSALSLLLFFLPVITSLLFNWPHHRSTHGADGRKPQ